MKRPLGPVLCLIAALCIAVPGHARAGEKEEKRLAASVVMLEEFMESPDQSIPQDLLEDCEAIVLIPRTISGGIGLGGRYGEGVVLRHIKKRKTWTAPAFYTLGGISLGSQIGLEAVDLILVVNNEKGLEALLKTKAMLGADAGVALGPMGRNAAADTDASLRAAVFSYSRSKGLYIGLSLKGAALIPNNKANLEYYGKELTARNILIESGVSHRAETRPLVRALNRYAHPAKKGMLLPAALVFLAGTIALFVLRKPILKLRQKL